MNGHFGFDRLHPESAFTEPPRAVDGVVGVPNVVQVVVQDFVDTFRCRLAGRVIGPDGGAVAFTPTANFGPPDSVTLVFTPMVEGTYVVEIEMPESKRPDGKYRQEIVVVPQAEPSVVLPRRCLFVSQARGMFACDDTLFSHDGGPVAVLDGGLWFGDADALFAWRAETLSTATFVNGQPTFGPAVESPLLRSWSLSGSHLGVSGDVNGRLYSVDAGTLTLVSAFQPKNQITVLQDGRAVGRDDSKPGCSDGFRRLAISDRVVAYYSVDFNSRTRVNGCCEWDATDGGFVSAPAERCFFPAAWFPEPGIFGNLPRRTLAATSRGLRLSTGGAMYLKDAVRSGSTDDIVWQSSDSETAIWR